MEEGEEFIVKKFKVSCCRSYLSPKGRCYSCPEDEPAGVDHEEKDDL